MNKKKTIISVDGNEACAYGAYAFSEVSAIYPITPSSPMAEHIDAWSSKGKKNIFGSNVKVVEMQSEAGASGAVHGALQAGALASTYTASQGLLLMIPNIYKMVGELLPAVLHVSARSLATRALSIFGDHQDIYAVRQTGACMICSHSVQEAADLAPLAHLIAIKAGIPVVHFFDGFRTSHEIQKVELQNYEDLAELVDKNAIKRFKENALNPHSNSVTRGGAENDDIYFQAREAQNKHLDNVGVVAQEYFKKISKLTKRKYGPFTYYGASDATRVIVAMGSVTQTIEETVDTLNARGEKVGLVKVHLYRPFLTDKLVSVLPSTCTSIAVLDRTKEAGATGEPLYLDVVAALYKENKKIDVVVGGRYGLSRVMSVEVYVNDELINVYHGDGILVSTPTGTTGYNLSAGGPIAIPDAKLLVITPICVHSLYSRSIIVSEQDEVRIKVKEERPLQHTEAMATFDGRAGFKLKENDEIIISKAHKTTNFIKTCDKKFFDIVRDKIEISRN